MKHLHFSLKKKKKNLKKPFINIHVKSHDLKIKRHIKISTSQI